MSDLPYSLRRPVEEILTKLTDAAAIIQLREGVKPIEEERIENAFALLADKRPSNDTQSSKRRLIYFNFLESVNNSLGPSMVVLCAAGLGSSAVCNLKDRLRVALLSQMKKEGGGLQGAVLDSLGKAYSEKCKLNLILCRDPF